jgi:hypothetical protein
MRTNRVNRLAKPALARTITVVGKLDADSCSVNIAEEGITLGFQRNAGIIQCTSRMADHPDTPARASGVGFDLARKAAVAAMNALQKSEGHRSERMEPIIDHASIIECTLSYAGNQYSYSCRVELPLVWENVYHSATFLNDKSVYLSDTEWHKLKQRAFGQIQKHRRARGCYGKDGTQPFIETETIKLAPDVVEQLSFSL